MESIQLIQHYHIKRRCGCTFLFVSPYMQISMILSAVHQSMYKPGIAMKCEYNWFVSSKHCIKIFVGQTMRMFTRRLESHQVNHIYYPHLEFRIILPQEINRRKCLQCWNISSASHNYIWFAINIIACPLPDTNA